MHSSTNSTLQSFKIENNFYYDSLSVIVTFNIPLKIRLKPIYSEVLNYSPDLIRCSVGKLVPFRYNCWGATEASHSPSKYTVLKSLEL